MVFASNNALTVGRVSTTSVNTPKTVPNGIKMHSTPAMTRQKV
ncbi:MAG: hypothetical protein ACYSRQ_05120 [Planctomycetota bacterium]